MHKPVAPTRPEIKTVNPPKDPVVEDFVCDYGPLAAFTSFFATSSTLVAISYLNSPIDEHSFYEVHLGIGVFGNFILGVAIPGLIAFFLYRVFHSIYLSNCQAFRALSNFDHLMANSKAYRQNIYTQQVKEASEQHQKDLVKYYEEYKDYQEDLAKYEAEEQYRYENGLESQEVENARINREMKGIALAGIAAIGAAKAKREHDKREQWKKENEEWTKNMKAEWERRDREYEALQQREYEERERYRRNYPGKM